MHSDSSAYLGLVSRLEALERQNRHLKAGGFAIAAAIVAAVFIGAAEQASTQPITIKDASGHRVRIDATGVTVYDSSSRRAFVGLDDKGRPSLDLRDKDGTLRQSVYLSTDGYPDLIQADEKGNDRLWFYLSKPGNNPNFKLLDTKGTERANYYIGTEGEPELRLLDSSGTERAAFYIGYETHSPEITLEGPDGKERVAVSGQSTPFFRITDNSNQQRAFLGIYDDGNAGAFTKNASGTTTWSAP